MKSKQDFQSSITAAVANYPIAAQFFKARDQRFIAQLDAAATMFALMSSEMDVQAMEPYTKARDVTVLADAAAKGFLPYAKAMKVRIAVTNNDTVNNFVINIGDRIQDDQGRVWTAESAVTILPVATGSFQASQYQMDTITHYTTLDIPFLSVKVPKPDDGTFYASISVEDINSIPYRYAVGYTNVAVDEKVFALVSDENQDISVKFGARGVIGYQHEINEPFTIRYKRTAGAIELAADTKFTHQYAFAFYEDKSEMVLDEILSVGEQPIDIATLREILNYPSVYDDNAVFLGNFDFLIRRNLGEFEFLSIWNEQREETVRGPSVNNINKLFVAAKKTNVLDAALQTMITNVIKNADDSYRIGYLEIIEEEISLSITGYVSPIYDLNEIGYKIKEIMLTQYGKYSAFAKRGRAKILYKSIYALLKQNIQAFQDETSDIRVVVVYSGKDDGEPRTGLSYTRTSTTVTVTFANHGLNIGQAVYITEATDSAINKQIILTARTDDTFDFETAASGADGTLTVTIQPRPEKWRYVSEASLEISVQQAI